LLSPFKPASLRWVIPFHRKNDATYRSQVRASENSVKKLSEKGF
jgi:hypothetical protein